jgi:hypothetical protein
LDPLPQRCSKRFELGIENLARVPLSNIEDHIDLQLTSTDAIAQEAKGYIF